jgi:hypothetical protein
MALAAYAQRDFRQYLRELLSERADSATASPQPTAG